MGHSFDIIRKQLINDSLGEYISQSCSQISLPFQVTSINLTKDHLLNIRDDFYLKIINGTEPKKLILERFEKVIDTMIDSEQFTRYDPLKDGPLYVFKKNKKLLAEITTPIITYGSSDWNDIIMGSPDAGISRNNGIIVFVKDRHGELMMIVIDAWSLYGSAISKKPDHIDQKSNGSNRKILLATLKESTCLHLITGSYIFSQIMGKMCIICCEKPRNIRMACGHGIVCDSCLSKLSECPICRKPIHDLSLACDVSECYVTFHKLS